MGVMQWTKSTQVPLPSIQHNSISNSRPASSHDKPSERSGTATNLVIILLDNVIWCNKDHQKPDKHLNMTIERHNVPASKDALAMWHSLPDNSSDSSLMTTAMVLQAASCCSEAAAAKKESFSS